MGKWYRVIDPLNPLYGADVMTGGYTDVIEGDDDREVRYYDVEALRRMDMFFGDRPFQLVAKKGSNLGLMIHEDAIVESPMQSDVVVTGTDRPHGICLNESDMKRKDGCSLQIVKYERATQIALRDGNDKFVATSTHSDEFRDEWENAVIGVFASNVDSDEVVYVLRNN